MLRDCAKLVIYRTTRQWKSPMLISRFIAGCLLLGLFLTVGILSSGSQAEEVRTLALHSTAFDHNGALPRKYTCEGADHSPSLVWQGVPLGTRDLALIVDGPDAPVYPANPRMTWVHWVLFNIAPETAALSEGAATKGLPSGCRQGLNDWKRIGYGIPCPPVGRHRYLHKLHALDIKLDDLHTPTKAELERAMQGHILAETELIGTYQKGQ